MQKINSVKKVVLYGGTGQAKVVRPMLEVMGYKVAAVIDDFHIDPPFEDIDLYCGKGAFKRWLENRLDEIHGFCITIGNPHGEVKNKIYRKLV